MSGPRTDGDGLNVTSERSPELVLAGAEVWILLRPLTGSPRALLFSLLPTSLVPARLARLPFPFTITLPLSLEIRKQLPSLSLPCGCHLLRFWQQAIPLGFRLLLPLLGLLLQLVQPTKDLAYRAGTAGARSRRANFFGICAFSSFVLVWLLF